MGGMYEKIYLALGLMAILLLNAGCGSEGTGGIGGDARPETMQEQALHDDSVSKEYINALINGIEYAENMHMSKHDVYEQLTSDAGENFTKEEADYAVAHVDDPDNAENSEGTN